MSLQLFWMLIVLSTGCLVMLVCLMIALRRGQRVWWLRMLTIPLCIASGPAVVLLAVLLLRYMAEGEGTVIKPPVRFEPEQVAATKKGGQILTVVNEGPTAMAVQLRFLHDVDRVSVHGEDLVYLLPYGEAEARVNVLLRGDEPAAATPTVRQWKRAVEVPGSLKAPMPRILKREREEPDIDQVWLGRPTEVICFFVNKSDRRLHVEPIARLEPKVWWARARVGLPYQTTVYTVEPGEACWFHVYVVPWVGIGKASELRLSPTLVVSIQEHDSPPNSTPP